jgi:hypothetical protein
MKVSLIEIDLIPETYHIEHELLKIMQNIFCLSLSLPHQEYNNNCPKRVYCDNG